ncbi:hypothetical protein D3C76_1087130 [compost metagenome]
MLGAHLTHAPTDGADADQALGNAQQQAPGDQDQQAEQWKTLQQGRQQRQQATEHNPGQAIDDRPLGADAVRHAPGHGATEQGGEVLRADGQPGHDGTEPQLLVDITRQHRNRQTDAEEGNKGIEHDGDDLQGDRRGALRWQLLRRHEGSFAGGGGRTA